jgi:hypothetical protein
MVRSYIVYKGHHYSTQICTFYADCVHVLDYDDMSGIDEFIAPNGTYQYVEEEIEVNPLNYQTYLDNEQAREERRNQAIELAKASFPHKQPEHPYALQMADTFLFPNFRDYILDGHWEHEDDPAFPFFDREVYNQYRKKRDDYQALWRNHLDFFLSKVDEA